LARPLRCHALIWTAGKPIADQICQETNRILDIGEKRLTGSWFDIPAEWARGTVLVAAKNLNFKVFSHEDMLDRCRAMQLMKMGAA
jgi:hypothetical protein